MFTLKGIALAVALFVAPTFAKTDMEGCVSSKTVAYGGASLIWYLPDTGEICAFLDCGGGRAPPKTTVPGCDAYSGTATYSPSYLPGYGESVVSPTTTTAAGSTSLAVASSMTGLPTATGDTTALTGTGSFTAPLRPSAATLTSAASGSATSDSSTSTSTSSFSSSSSSSSASTAAGAIATTGPYGIIAGLAVGVAAMAL